MDVVLSYLDPAILWQADININNCKLKVNLQVGLGVHLLEWGERMNRTLITDEAAEVQDYLGKITLKILFR